jgi:hypothetical protein
VRPRLLKLKPTNAEGRHLRDAIFVDASDTLLVFPTRRDVEPTNNVSERALRPSVIFRKVTNGFRSDWGAKVYADLCSLVATARLNRQSPLAAIRVQRPSRHQSIDRRSTLEARIDADQRFRPEAVDGVKLLDLLLDVGVRIRVNERANRS